MRYDYDKLLHTLHVALNLEHELANSFPESFHADAERKQIPLDLIEHFLKYNPRPLVVETDVKGIILYANEAYALCAGYTQDELIGQNVNILKHDQNPKGEYQQLWQSVTTGKPWKGHLLNTNKAGGAYWIDLFVAPVMNENGEAEKFWGLGYDISELVKKEEELKDITREILDSMKYAKRIQRTILPSKESIDEYFEDHFEVFKPKDVVSGDFYFFAKTFSRVYVAAVDCTGHGVPGAFMSLIGYNILNNIVNNMGIHQPGYILSELHRQVRAMLKQDAEESKSRDGMDVVLVAIDIYGNEVQYAGANRPLYWVHNGNLVEIKADKMSIGGEQLEDDRIFTNHLLETSPGDILYLFTDGITDQFGGPSQKKFSTKRVTQFIEEHKSMSLSVQRAKFNNVWWRDWKADDEQTDDATFIALKLNPSEEQKHP
jgi:PAS domain S-box-containing protein